MGATSASNVYSFRRPHPVAGLIGVAGRGGQRRAVGVGTASGGGKPEGNPNLEPDLIGQPKTALLLVRGGVAGTGFEPV